MTFQGAQRAVAPFSTTTFTREIVDSRTIFGAPGEIRTPDPQVRRRDFKMSRHFTGVHFDTLQFMPVQRKEPVGN
jgi:hypothetical protein